jgi:Uma2 family endonuclease
MDTLNLSDAFLPLRAVMPVVPPEIVALRKESGADQWDEMWEGVLHMSAAPNLEHQDLEGDLATWLRIHWAWPRGGKVTQQANLAASRHWRRDYRIPDIILLSRERLSIRKREFVLGAPDVVVEIQIPRDESREKLAFYARLAVPEVWIIDRDTRKVEVLILGAKGYRGRPADRDGWTRSPATGVEIKATRARRLVVRLRDDKTTQAELPLD